MEIEKEIDDLIGNEPPTPTHTSEPAPEPELAPEPASVSEPAPEPSPSPEPEPIAEPAGEPTPPPVEPPATPAPEPSSDPRDAQIAQMADTIAALQKMVNDVAAAQVKPSTPAVEPTPSVAMKFVESEDALDEALKTADNFNAMLSGVMQKMQEQLSTAVQQIAYQAAHGVYTQRAAADDFYRANQDLAANKAFVAMVADEMAAAHPDWDILQVIEGLAEEVRSRLHIAMPGQVAPTTPVLANEPTSTPAFIRGGGARPGAGAPQVSEMQKELDSLLDGFIR